MPKVCPVCGTTYTDSNAFCPTDGTTLRSADVDGDLIGTVVADRYLVTDLLGEGGMGRVYLARHVRLPTQAAIKVLRPALLRDPASVARFNREASNASRIEHDRVARVFDFGETSDGTVYLAMEYVPGRTLKKLLTEEAPLAPLRAAALVKQVADGLDAAHRMGIVHRDLKPDNILVMTDDGSGDRAKVVDFGIAKAIGGDANESGLTQTGFVVGTPEFMAPEQMLGGLIDARTDMYALALVAFQCLTNALPFDTTTPDRGLTARMTEAPRRLDFVVSNVTWPAQLQAVFDKALVRDIDQRFATAGAFADALTQAVYAWVGVAAPLTAASFGATAALTAPDAHVGAQTSSERVSVDNRSPVPPTTSRKSTFLIGGIVVGVAAIIVVIVMILKSGNSTAPQTASNSTDTAATVPAANGSTSLPNDTTSKKSDTNAPITAPTTSADPGATRARGATPTNPPASVGQAQVPTNPQQKPGVTPTGTGGVPTNAASIATRTLDSVTKAMQDADQSQARTAAGIIQRLLPRLPTLTDSVWAYIRLYEANMMAGEESSACTPLRSAKRLAVTPIEIQTVKDYAAQSTCAP